MKIRIKGNSLRLRLTQTEVDSFGEEGYCRSSVSFGNSAMTYALKRWDKSHLSADYKRNTITVYIPEKLAVEWCDTERVGMEGEIDVGSGEKTAILVEKDFQCLKPRPGEDESDHYPNPLADNKLSQA